MRSYTRLTLTLLLAACVSTSLFSQKEQKHWLDNGLQTCKKGKATHYLIMGPSESSGFPVTLHRLDGSIKMQGASSTVDGLTFEGPTTFYHPNGQMESKGEYLAGNKVGLWERWNKDGKSLAERSYASFDHRHMAYTYVDDMPQFEGGEEKFREFLKHRIATYVSELRADGKEVNISFVISEKGNIENIKMLDGEEEIANEQIAKVFSEMPDWRPGQKQGSPVRVLMTMPIRL